MDSDLVTVEYAKWHLRIDGADDDAWLTLAIKGVSRVVREWCGNDDARIMEADGVTVRANVVTAVLVEVAYQYANREGPAAAYQQDWYLNGYTLSAGATAFLQPNRLPVVV